MHAIQFGDVQAWVDLCTDDVIFEFPFAPPGRPSRVEGKQALGEYLTAVPSRVEFDRLSNLETHQTLNPDVAIFEMTAIGRVKDTGEPYEMSYVVVLTVRDENRQPVKDAVVWLDGRKFTPDEKSGSIIVPFTQQPGAQVHPFLLAHLALEDGLLNPSAVVLACARHAAQTAQAGFLDRGDVISDEDEHGRLRLI